MGGLAVWISVATPPPDEPSTEEVRQWVRTLSTGATEDRRNAKLRLVRFGPRAVPLLAEALQRNDEYADGTWIAETLAAYGEAASPAGEALWRRLMRGGRCSNAVAFALRSLGPKGVPWLVRVIRESDSSVAIQSALSRIGDFGAQAASEARYVVQRFDRGQDKSVRVQALRTIGLLGEAAKHFVADIRVASDDSDFEIRAASTEALRGASRAGDVAALDLLMTIIEDDKDEEVRAEAVGVLGGLGRPATPAEVQSLRRAREDPSHLVRRSAEAALRAIATQ